jgi:hypothetical protein
MVFAIFNLKALRVEALAGASKPLKPCP